MKQEERGFTGDNEIMTVEEAAKYLHMCKRSVYKLAKSGKLPAKMVLNKWRFERSALRAWVKEA